MSSTQYGDKVLRLQLGTLVWRRGRLSLLVLDCKIGILTVTYNSIIGLCFRTNPIIDPIGLRIYVQQIVLFKQNITLVISSNHYKTVLLPMFKKLLTTTCFHNQTNLKPIPTMLLYF